MFGDENFFLLFRPPTTNLRNSFAEKDFLPFHQIDQNKSRMPLQLVWFVPYPHPPPPQPSPHDEYHVKNNISIHVLSIRNDFVFHA